MMRMSRIVRSLSTFTRVTSAHRRGRTLDTGGSTQLDLFYVADLAESRGAYEHVLSRHEGEPSSTRTDSTVRDSMR